MGVDFSGTSDSFQVGLKNSLSKKYWKRNLKKKKKYNHNFYKPSLVAPCSNSFLIVKICILIFHGNSSPHTPTNIYIYLRGLYVIARNWENVRFPRDPAYFGYLISFLGEGTRSSMTNHINTRVVDDKVFCFMCLC